MSWRKLVYAVNGGDPTVHKEPICVTRDGVVTQWNDSRTEPTQSEIDAVTDTQVKTYFAEVRKEQNSDIRKVSPILKAYILCINDGSIIPGGNLSPKQLKAAIKAKL